MCHEREIAGRRHWHRPDAATTRASQALAWTQALEHKSLVADGTLDKNSNLICTSPTKQQIFAHVQLAGELQRSAAKGKGNQTLMEVINE